LHTSITGSKLVWFACLLVYFLAGCSKSPIREVGPTNPPPPPPDDTTKITYEHGAFIINEGNYSWGNASVTYIDGTTDSVYQDIFKTANNRGLGDVAQSMKVMGDKGFIIVNNSNRIEVVSLKDFKTLATISGFNSPRYIEFVDSGKAYVTNMKRNISVVDLNSLTIVKNIPTPYWTEGLLKYGDYMYVTCIGSFNETSANRKAQMYIVDTRTDLIVDSVMMGKEPVSITVDRKDKIWVLCTGGYDNFEPPTLKRVDPAQRIVEKSFDFPSQQGVPSRLCMNPTHDTLYYLYNGVYQMPASAASLPTKALIPSAGRLFYGLAVHPKTGQVYVSDAIDYVQSGNVYKCSQSGGTLLHTYKAGRIPGSFCFTENSGK